MNDLIIIRQEQARKIEATWNPDNIKNRSLTTKYVLGNGSLKYFKRLAPKVEEIFQNCLYTNEEYCVKKPQGYLVNGLLLQLFISSEKPDSYTINVYGRGDGKLEKTCFINKYVLQALALSYGYYVRNAEYIVAAHWTYRQGRSPKDVSSYLVVYTDGKSLYYQPHMRLIYSDGSYSITRGARTIDTLSATSFNGKIKVGVHYARDLLSDDRGFKLLNGSSPFREV